MDWNVNFQQTMIKNILFDFGGVIAPIDREKAIEAFVRLGLADADQRLDKYHQTGIFQELEEGAIDAQTFQDKLGVLCGRKLEWEETRQAWLGFFTGVDEAMLECLEELRRRYRLYVLSNTNPYVMDWACSEEFSARRKPLNAYFDKLYLSYQLGVLKPDERIFRMVVEDSGIVPSETLFVDDGASNIAAGHKAGFVTYQPENGEDWRDAFQTLLKD